MTRVVRLAPLLALPLLLVVLARPGTARADVTAERALAEKYAPVVRLVQQRGECQPGEPFEPIDVNLLFGNREVAFRGPWSPNDLVKIGPVATDLEDRFEYHLDFPGDALDPGCIYDEWSKRLTAGHTPTVYAHVAQQRDRPDRLALQYWFFYVFNDFNNKHEGDWEMIQLVFDAATSEQALEQTPVEVGYSAHEGAERASWGDEKLELVDGTHPVVYPAAGSHANKFTPALYLGSSASAGVGCDDTRGPHRQLRPAVVTIPSDPAAARAAFPWLTFEGRWGELQKAFFNGPTGPNMKTQWTEPITWMADWRDVSYAVPTGGVLGTGATDFFCVGVARGSETLLRLLRNPLPTFLFLAALVGLVVFLVVRATWTPATPRRVGHRRAWGQILAASARMYVRRPGLMLGLGLLFIPISVVITLLQWVVLRVVDLLGVVTGQGAGTFAYLALLIGVAVTLLGLAVVQAAVACALAELDRGGTTGPIHAYRLALRRLGPLVGGTMLFVVAWLALTTTIVLVPVAVWLAVRWSLLAPAVALEDRGAVAALHRSGELVRHRWLKVGSLVGVGAAIALVSGPLIGALLIFVVNSPLALLNVVAGLVYVLALPFVALVTAYVYADARARVELEPVTRVDELPAEIELTA